MNHYNQKTKDRIDKFTGVIQGFIPTSLRSITKVFTGGLRIGVIPAFQALDMFSGIYFLCDGNDVVYVGQSSDVIMRVIAHHREKKKVFDQVFFLPCCVKHLNREEEKYIKLLVPKYNSLRFSKVANRSRRKQVNWWWTHQKKKKLAEPKPQQIN